MLWQKDISSQSGTVAKVGEKDDAISEMDVKIKTFGQNKN